MVGCPTINGGLNYDIPGSEEGISVDPSAIIDNLEMTFMGTYEARKYKWSFEADALYLDLANSDNTTVTMPGGPALEISVDQGMTAWMLGFYAGYNIVQSSNITLDLIARARYLSLEVNAGLQIDGPLPTAPRSLDLAQKEDLWDAVVGIKGSIDLNENWYLPYHFDIGAGDSDLT